MNSTVVPVFNSFGVPTEEDLEEGFESICDVSLDDNTPKKTCGSKRFARLACLGLNIIGTVVATSFIMKYGNESQKESVQVTESTSTIITNPSQALPDDILSESDAQTSPPSLSEEAIVKALKDFLPNLPDDFDSLMSLTELNTGEHGKKKYWFNSTLFLF